MKIKMVYMSGRFAGLIYYSNNFIWKRRIKFIHFYIIKKNHMETLKSLENKVRRRRNQSYPIKKSSKKYVRVWIFPILCLIYYSFAFLEFCVMSLCRITAIYSSQKKSNSFTNEANENWRYKVKDFHNLWISAGHETKAERWWGNRQQSKAISILIYVIQYYSYNQI